MKEKKDKEDDEGRLIFKDGKLIMINNKEPVLQVRRELIIMGTIVGVN